MNTNLIHNVLNIVMAVVAVLGLPEVIALIPVEWAVTITGAAATLKLVINVVRDGLAGLAKTQPPVE